MRERFDEFSNREVVGSTKLKDFKYLYPDLLDFIEQELKLKDQEHKDMILALQTIINGQQKMIEAQKYSIKAELEMIKGEIKEYFEGLIHVPNPQLTGNKIIAIIDTHINKLSTESGTYSSY